MIHKKRFLLIFLVPFCFLSCSKNETIFKIESFMDATIIAGSSTISSHFYEQEIIFPYSGQVSAFGLTNDEIAKVIPQRAVLYPVFSDDIDLEFIDVIVIEAFNPENPQDDKEVFYLEPVPIGSKKEIELFPSLPNIKSYIIEDKLNLRLKLQYRLFPPQNLEVRIDVEFGAIEVE